MQITHKEARHLIHFKADASPNRNNDQNLAAHLQTCTDCRAYAESLRVTESLLRQSLQRHLDIRPLPLSIDILLRKTSAKKGMSVSLTTRNALLGIAFLMMAVITWRSASLGNAVFSQPPSGTVPVIPTPSTFTATNTQQDTCREVPYVVQEGDTLDDIARRFAVPVEAIRLDNHLTGDTLLPTRELILNLCDSTPAGTVNAPTFTITPALQIVITTPG